MAIKGYRKSLDQQDMWELSDNNKSTTIKKRFDHHLSLPSTSMPSTRSTKVQVNLFFVLIKNFWPTLLFGSICKIIASLLVFASPQLMDQLLTFIVSNQPIWKGYVIAFTIFVASMAQTIFDSQFEFWTNVTSMRIRSALITAIYRKV